MSVPPKSIKLRWCPVCGRTDRVSPFTGKGHFSAGARCVGQPERLTYYLANEQRRVDA